MTVKFSKKFRKQYQKADKKIQVRFNQKLALFLTNPFHSQLNNHQLTGTYLDYRSINVTGDWRAIYSENAGVVVFELLGTHSQLY